MDKVLFKDGLNGSLLNYDIFSFWQSSSRRDNLGLPLVRQITKVLRLGSRLLELTLRE